MNAQHPKVLVFVDDRPTSTGGGLYQWAVDAEDLLRRLHAEIERLTKANDGQTRLNVTLVLENSELIRERDAMRTELDALHAQKPAYHVEVTGRLHETEPTALASDLPDGRHPLYAAPRAPAAPIVQPLTDGQIVGIAIGAGVDAEDDDDDGQTVFAIARAVEAACAKAWGVKLEGVRCNAGLGLVQKREQLGE